MFGREAGGYTLAQALHSSGPLAMVVAGILIGLESLLRRRYHLPRRTGLFVTWGGLRGGISIALALSLHPGPRRELIVLITYVIVVFAVVVQGLSAGAALRLLRIPQDR